MQTVDNQPDENFVIVKSQSLGDKKIEKVK